MAHPVLLQRKYTRLIAALAEQLHCPLEEALKDFYHSETYQLMSRGISDMHCRSDAYLLEDLIQESLARRNS